MGAPQVRKGASPLKKEQQEPSREKCTWVAWQNQKEDFGGGTARQRNVYGEERGLGPARLGRKPPPSPRSRTRSCSLSRSAPLGSPSEGSRLLSAL